MDKNKKIIIIALSAFLSVCVFAGGIVAVTRGGTDEPDSSQSLSTGSAEASSEITSSLAEVSSEPSSEPSAASSQPSTTQALSGILLQDALIGSWADSAGMSGFKFTADGFVEMTYVNLTVPVVNLPINGTSKGVYTVEGDTVTVKFSIYSATIERRYRASIEGNVLTMTDLEDMEKSTYTRQAASQLSSGTTAATSSTAPAEDIYPLVGSWKNSDATVKYTFNSNGTALIRFNNATHSAADGARLTAEIEGIYLGSEKDVTIQYTLFGSRVTEKYQFVINNNILSFTDPSGEVLLFSKEGSASGALSEAALLGSWSDGADMSGYEFKEGGVVNVTYVNFTVPVINMPINGTYKGSYALDGDKLSISYSVYGKSVKKTFTAALSENSLVLTDSESGETATYLRK